MPAKVAARITASFIALAMPLFACGREPCMKLGHPWYPATDLDLITDGPKPRCAASDPTCGPEPYRAERACYDPSAPRLHVAAPNDEPRRERCTHDGECVVSVCRVCAHYSVALGISCAKKEDEEFDETVLCGCLDGGCWFFRH